MSPNPSTPASTPVQTEASAKHPAPLYQGPVFHPNSDSPGRSPKVFFMFKHFADMKYFSCSDFVGNLHIEFFYFSSL